MPVEADVNSYENFELSPESLNPLLSACISCGYPNLEVFCVDHR